MASPPANRNSVTSAVLRIIATCQVRCAEAERHVQPTRLVAEPPAHTRPPYPLLLALHGYDGTAAASLPVWAPVATHGWLVAALQSGQLAGMAGYHWMDEVRTQQDVRQHLDELAATSARDLRRLAIGGFSNGGRAALLLALTGAVPASQVVSVGAALRDETLAEIDWHALGSAGTPRVLWIVGDQDMAVLPRITEQADLFSQNGVDVTVQVIPNLGHTVPPDLSARVAAWLQGDMRGS
jgi:predicted esterase